MSDGNTIIGTSDKTELEPFPCERPNRHKSVAWKESASSRLGALHLLVVASGGVPPQAACIVDEPLLPELPPDHRDFERRLESNNRIQTRIKENAIKRWFITMNAWTALYGMLARCCEKTAPTLFRTLQDQCNLEKTHGLKGGFMDGPRAWKIVNVWLNLDNAHRTKADKEYYRLAEKLMRENQLADWCLATEYEAKALAWIVNVMPNTPYVHAAADAGEIIIDMMPDCLMADKRRLSSELKKSGMITNLREVMRECSAVVFDAQSKHDGPPPDSTVTVPAAVAASFNLLDLAGTCGMTLVTNTERPGAFAANAAKSKAWCPGCPHMGRNGREATCYQSPYRDVALPPSVDQDNDKRTSIEKARKANAEKEKIEYKPLPRADHKAVIKWKGEKAAEKAAEKAEKGSPDVPAGLVVPAGESWLDTIQDLDDPDFGSSIGQMLVAHMEETMPQDIKQMISQDECLECSDVVAVATSADESLGAAGAAPADATSRGSSFYQPYIVSAPSGDESETIATANLPPSSSLPPLPPVAAAEIATMLGASFVGFGGSGGPTVGNITPLPAAPTRATATAARDSLPPPTPLPDHVATLGDGMEFKVASDGAAKSMVTPPPMARSASEAATRSTVEPMAKGPGANQESPASPPSPIELHGLVTAATELKAVAWTAVNYLVNPCPWLPGYACAVFAAILAGGAMSACTAPYHNTHSTAGALGGMVTVTIIHAYHIGHAQVLGNIFRAASAIKPVGITVLTAVLQAMVYAVMYAHSLTILFILLCLVGRCLGQEMDTVPRQDGGVTNYTLISLEPGIKATLPGDAMLEKCADVSSGTTFGYAMSLVSWVCSLYQALAMLRCCFLRTPQGERAGPRNHDAPLDKRRTRKHKMKPLTGLGDAEVVLHAEQEIQRLCYLLLKLYGILLRRLKANAVEFCSINSLVRG